MTLTTAAAWTSGTYRNGKAAREGELLTFTCPACDSKTLVGITTKRKSKGKRLKAAEAVAKAEHAAKIAAAEVENDRIALELLAHPGCSCANRRIRYLNSRRDGLIHGETSNGIRAAPRHSYNCDLRESALERAARGEAAS